MAIILLEQLPQIGRLTSRIFFPMMFKERTQALLLVGKSGTGIWGHRLSQFMHLQNEEVLVSVTESLTTLLNTQQ